MHLHWGEIKRFAIAGIFNTSFSYGIYALCLWLGLPYPVANFIAMVIGVCVGFITQGLFVFRRLELRRIPLFVLTWLLLWGLNVALIGVLMLFVERNAYLAGAAALPVMVCISFFVQKTVVFGNRIFK